MCGIVGLLDPDGFGEGTAARRRLMEDMRDSLAHRGPDDAGTWLDPSAGFAVGFRRLAIVDLTSAGHQPMVSADGRWVLVMNGEVYNHPELRTEIEGSSGGARSWRGHSDTEALLEAIALWGVEAAVIRANGMFAFAAWDRQARTLWLARDRIGKKPLYYGWAGGAFVFGSELKALRRHPGFDLQVSHRALSSYFRLGYVLGRDTIFAGTHKLPGGCLLRLGPDVAARRGTPQPVAYWNLRDVALAGLDAQASGRCARQEELQDLLDDAVRRRMVADVPVGAFLSGGVDSSLVTAMMAAGSGTPAHTFTVGFDLPQWDEAPHAKAVAAHLGTRHEELYVSAAEVMDVVRDVPRICDEPFADDSILPTTLLCRMARRSVTVALSGDGGDELFAGYQRYADAARWLARRAAVPPAARALVRGFVDHLARPAAERWSSQRTERRLGLLSHLLRSSEPEGFNSVIMSQSLDTEALFADSRALPEHLAESSYVLGRSTPIDRMTFMDLASFLVDDILTKVDRASMSTSLEVRCPLLDYRVIEMSWRFPTGAKSWDGRGKLPLRAALDRYVPRELVERPKMGFSAPVEAWVRNELRDWAEALVSRAALARHGLLDVDACRRLWEGFAHRGRGWDRAIWNLLMFQAWHAANQDGQRATTPTVRAELSGAPVIL